MKVYIRRHYPPLPTITNSIRVDWVYYNWNRGRVERTIVADNSSKILSTRRVK